MSALPVGPLEPESLPLSLVQKDRIMEAHVSTLRFQLHTQVVQNTDTETSTQLLMSHASIKQRYKILNFPQLLQANSQSLVELQRLNVALAILEKYGRHLMRPLSLRSAQWATIKFINPIFAEKVDIVQGGRDIMAKLGYSVDLGDGLSYPEGVEPDPQHLSIIVADIVLAQQEIHKLISRQHPAVEGLNSYLSERCLYEIAYSTGANVGYPASAMPAQPAVNQQQPYSMRPSPAIPPLRLKPNLALSLASSQLSSSSSDCEICGEKSPDMVCTICNSKQLCRSCDEKWHKHPRRQNHHRTHLKHETLSSRQPTQPRQWPQSGSSLANPVAGYMSASPGVWQPVSMPPAVPEVLRVHNGPGDDKPPSLLNAPQSQPDSGDSPSSDDSFHSTEESNPQTTLHGYPPPLPDAFRTDSYKSPITVLSRELAAIKDSRQEKKKELNAIIGSSDAFQENELYQKLTRESDQLLRKKLVLERKIKELELNNISLLPEKVYLPPPSQNMSAQSDSLLPPTRSAEVNPEPNFELGTNLPHRNGRNVNAHNTLPNLRTLDMKHIQVGKASATLPKPNFRQQVVQSLETQEELQQFDSGKLVLAEIGVGDSNQRKQRRGREFMRQWHCEHCTVINPPGGNICSVCHKTSDNPRLVQQEASADGALKEGAPAEGAIRGTVTSIDTSIHSGSSFGERTRHVFEEAEEIQAQKEEARRKLALMMKEEEIKQQQPQQDLDETENIADADRGAECQLDDWTMLNNPRAKCAVSATKPCLSTKVIDHIQEKSKTTNAEKSSTKGNNLKLDVALASQNREAENGKRVVQFLREVSDHGFEPAELQLALQKCGAEQNPFDWLRQSLQTVINTVVTLVTNEGAKLDENDVGEISATEAKRKLLEMNGDVDKTVKACVRERRKKVQTVMADGPFSRESALEALLRYNGDVNAATSHLQAPKMKPFAERIWEEPVEDQREAAVPCANPNPDYQFVANSITDRKDFEQTVKNSSICVQRRTRMVFVEGRLRSWGRAQVVLKILTEHKEFSLKDVIEAVQNCGDVRGSLAFLQQDCEICFTSVPMSKIRNFTLCQCKLCVECISQHLEFNIREKFVKDWSCPICNKPDVQQELSDAEEHFSFVDMLLQTLLGREIRELFQDKLRDWRLMQDPNFRWCAHCGNGFIFNGFALKMECASCKRFTCFKCKKPWESQHEGLTCEQFEQWRVDNNPENQATGLARHLDTNGIVCPSCKMRYVLAKGGCMHFTCPQCGHEFCCGCHLPFRRAENCKRYQSCRNQGLHCHHPRDCFFYLRDNSVEELQSLLEKHKVEFNKDAPNGQENTDTCAVMEQKEVANQRRDEACGRDVVAGHAGLCQIHYKEYLVDLINKHGIDPVILLSVDDIKNLLIKMEMEVPSVNRNETSRNYHKRLRQFVQQEIPLQRKNSSGQT